MLYKLILRQDIVDHDVSMVAYWNIKTSRNNTTIVDGLSTICLFVCFNVQQPFKDVFTWIFFFI